MNEMESDFLEVAIESAKKGGDVILSNIGKLLPAHIHSKKASDFVTRVDIESESAIVSVIKKHFPQHSILTEESLKDKNEDGYRWIIDPLDGTTNFIHSYPAFSVSIALQKNREIIVGVIYDPLRKQLFTAIKNEGALCNGNKISVSKPDSLEKCIVLTGFPFRMKDKVDLYLKIFKGLFLKIGDLRRGGSAALDLAYVAAGIGDGFFEIGLNAWDIAAGSLIVQEAGGIVSDFEGGNNYLQTGNIIAGSPQVHSIILEQVKKFWNGLY